MIVFKNKLPNSIRGEIHGKNTVVVVVNICAFTSFACDDGVFKVWYNIRQCPHIMAASDDVGAAGSTDMHNIVMNRLVVDFITLARAHFHCFCFVFAVRSREDYRRKLFVFFTRTCPGCWTRSESNGRLCAKTQKKIKNLHVHSLLNVQLPTYVA